MEPLLTVHECAVLLKVTERTVRRLCRSGELKAFKVGGQWRVSAATIDALNQDTPAKRPIPPVLEAIHAMVAAQSKHWKIVSTQHGQPLETYDTVQEAQKALDRLRVDNDALIAVPGDYQWDGKGWTQERSR